MIKENAQIVIAGPGAGKTHDMILKILEVLPGIQRQPNRICAVITYTNAATEEIRERISKHIPIPQNLFIGTSHSFLIRFIIEPYLHLYETVSNEKNYIDRIELPDHFKRWIISKIDEKNYKTPTQRSQAIWGMTTGIENKTINSLSVKGIITYEKVLELSFNLIDNKDVLRIVANRIAYLFVDEYQDIHVYQHQVLMKIVEQGYTKIYCVGDPLQSIYKFSYGQSQIRIKKEFKFDDLNKCPILKLKQDYPEIAKHLATNHRSTKNITKILSRYTIQIEYEQETENVDGCPVYFIESGDKKNICNWFYKIAEQNAIPFEPQKIKFLHLSKEWKFWEDDRVEQKLVVIDKGNHRNSTLMQELSRCVLGIVGMIKKDAFELMPSNNHLEKTIIFRKFCMDIYKEIKRDIRCSNISERIRNLFSKNFNYTFPNDWKSPCNNSDLKSSIESLLHCRPEQNFNLSDKYYSTIHSAKGLEATCVLVCARTKNELKNWLNFNNVTGENDETRYGFVAFSRARKLLCIACNEKIGESEKRLFNDIGIEVISGDS